MLMSSPWDFTVHNGQYRVRVVDISHGYRAKLISVGIGTIMASAGNTSTEALMALVEDLHRDFSTSDRRLAKEVDANVPSFAELADEITELLGPTVITGKRDPLIVEVPTVLTRIEAQLKAHERAGVRRRQSKKGIRAIKALRPGIGSHDK